MKHFGIQIKDKPTNYINKETYLSAKPEGMRGWNEEHYPKQRLKASLNYDLNMRFFESLDKNMFDRFLSSKCKKFRFKECFDLKELSGVYGVYMMVLDNYKQVYIGISTDIKSRIQNHWNRRKSLERLIFGDVLNSIISIDCFGALDTTRIFYIKSSSMYKLEKKIVEEMDGKFLINRTSGGIGSVDTYTGDVLAASIAVVGGRRTKNLVPFVKLNELKDIFNEAQLKYYFEKYPGLNNSKE